MAGADSFKTVLASDDALTKCLAQVDIGAGIRTATDLHMSAAMHWIHEPSQSLFRRQRADVIVKGGPCRQTDNLIPLPEGPGLGVTLDRKALDDGHPHLMENGSVDHFHHPNMRDVLGACR